MIAASAAGLPAVFPAILAWLPPAGAPHQNHHSGKPMPPKSAKSAPRLLMPAEPPRDRARFTTTHLALLAVPIALWLLYGWLRPVPAIVIPPPAATAPAEVAAAAATPPVPATRQDAAPPAADADAAAQDPLADYPRAEGTWGDVLNPQKLIPGTGYTAYFLDTGQSRAYGIADDGKPRNEVQVMHSVMPAYTPEPGHIRAAEHVARIRVSDHDEDSYGIPAYRFAAYWAGRLHVPQRGLYHINFSPFGAQTRILLDKHILADGRRDGSLTLELLPGDHLLEVEYTNGGVTAGFRFSLNADIPEVPVADLPRILAGLALPAATVTYLVDVNGSNADDDGIRLDGPYGDAPYILILNSRRAVQWQLNGRPPAVVLYNLANQGSRVHAVDRVPLLAWGEGIATAPPDESLDPPRLPECECRASGFYCSTRNLTLYDYAAAIYALTGYPLAGFNHADSVKTLAIPAVPVTAQALAPGERIVREVNDRRTFCYRTLSR